MKTLILFSVSSTLLNAALAQAELGAFESILQALAQVPLVGGMAWILLRQQDNHTKSIDTLTNHWLTRARERDQFYQLLLADMVKSIEELAKK